MSIESVMSPNHLILYRPLFLLPSIFPSIRAISNELALHIRWPKYWSFSFSISPSIEYSGLISFRIDWFDLLAVQGTFKSSLILQFQSMSSSALSFLYSPTLTSIHDYWKTIHLTIQIFISKAMLLLLIHCLDLSQLFFPKSKYLLILRLKSLSAVILEPKKMKSVTVSTVSRSICHEVMGPDAMILIFWMLSFKSAFSLFSFFFNFIYIFYFLNFKIFNSYMRSQTWTPLPPPSP